MTKEEYIILFEKHLSGKATPEEEALLLSYSDGFNIQDFHNIQEIDNQLQVQQAIFNRIEESRNKPVRKIALSFWWAAAASLLLVVSAGLFLFNNRVVNKPNYTSNNLAQSFKPIVPGGNKAILTLANGSKIDLDKTANGIIEQNKQVEITKEKNGQLVYASDNSGSNEDDKLSFNTISTPRGGQYQIILPDSTKVWLNAASSLKYPVKFIGTERHVELNGEAYFEVAKNKKMPFIIDANNINIRVLGTHFDVMAYQDESVTKTTLLEGSIRLSAYNKEATLIPGQQGSVSTSGKTIQLGFINTQDAISWKDGYFTFRNENIESVMKKLARWYDVTVEYHGDFSNVYFGGTISRTKNIQELLNRIQMTESVHFKVEERRIIVSK
ncbi:MAG: hypothetical protein JWQ09_4786 [Segetibacter sp.]|nr:hypothetical protein [Segetibacter sp.]